MPGFQKGQSGNPKGRRAAHLGCQKLRDLIGDHAESVVKRLILAAVNDGDVQAARLLVDRSIAPLKPIEPTAPCPIPPDGSLAEQGRAVVLALSRGKLPVSQASALLNGLATLGRLFEVDEILERLGRAEAEIQAMQRPPPALPSPAAPPEPAVEPAQQQPEPEPPACTRVELAPGETLMDVANTLGIEVAELQSQIADGLVIILPAEEPS